MIQESLMKTVHVLPLQVIAAYHIDGLSKELVPERFNCYSCDRKKLKYIICKVYLIFV